MKTVLESRLLFDPGSPPPSSFSATTLPQVFNQFGGNIGGPVYLPHFGQGGKGFGWGTVHHAAGTLRMPYRPRDDSAAFDFATVVDEDLRVGGTQNLYVCDMSVLPVSTAANPVRALAGLALRLANHLS